ncbi:MAG: phosphonoacetaldehyde reductase [Deltaproteobacteria bacterium]|jgi:alcohol dehydrogenase class IV|nr:phosphonoacetaldehyde reductase [Deltaproteobacteria bacterium]
MDISNVKFLSLDELKNALENIPFEAPLVIISQSAEKRWNLSDTLRKVTSSRPGARRVDDPRPNPTLRDIAGRLSTPLRPDGIVAIGGGSAIDLGKALNALRHLESPSAGDILQAMKARDYAKALPLIAVPSTSGTGSEVTGWATVWDDENHQKFSVDSPDLVPARAWIVPELTHGSPLRLTLATGLDAVSHASEAYWAMATDRLSQNLSLAALRLLTRYLPQALSDLSAPKPRHGLAEGSLLAGLSFSRTRTTACHSISYPLTSLFGLEHGFAAALTLGQVAEINSRHVDLTEFLEVFAPHGGVQAWLDRTSEPFLPLRLSSFGISGGDVDGVASKASTQGRMDNNPVALDLEAIRQILSNVL